MNKTKRKQLLNQLKDQITIILESKIDDKSFFITREQYMKTSHNVVSLCSLPSPPSSHFGNGRSIKVGGGDVYVLLSEYLVRHMKKILGPCLALESQELLSYHNTNYLEYIHKCKYFNNMFGYLNRYWVTRTKNSVPISNLCVIIWREHLFYAIRNRFSNAILSIIRDFRGGVFDDTQLLHVSVDILILISVNSNPFNIHYEDNEEKKSNEERQITLYKEVFEKPFLEETRLYYSTQATSFLETHTITEYLHYIEMIIAKESKDYDFLVFSLSKFFDPSMSTLPKLVDILENVLIQAHLPEIGAYFRHALSAFDTPTLGLIYSLVSRVDPQIETFKDIFYAEVTAFGNNAIENLAVHSQQAFNDPKRFIETVISVYKRFNSLVLEQFKLDPTINTFFDKACRSFINFTTISGKKVSSTKAPELLVRYIDYLLRFPNKNEQETMEQLNDAMDIFKFFEDKDVFQTFYSKLMARRLIAGSCFHHNLEEFLVGQLKEVCGYEYTSRLQIMFTDFSLSDEILLKYKKFLSEKKERPILKFDFNIKVLQMGAWPLSSPNSSFQLFEELKAPINSFNEFYLNTHCGRKLSWVYELSRVELFAYFEKTYLLNVSTFEAAVLMMFNRSSRKKLSFLSILDHTQLPKETLFNILHTLIHYELLSICSVTQLPMNQPIENLLTEGSSFSCNTGFKSRRYKIMLKPLNKLQQSEELSEKVEITQSIDNQRKMELQACIVRLLKTKNQLEPSKLLKKVRKTLSKRFIPSDSDIYNVIEILNEKEFIRVKDDLFEYVA